ncbi:MAG: ATP-binding protein [Candidatus Thiodiazotropha sp.]
MLSNLISNAFKFTEQGSITLRIVASTPHDSSVCQVHFEVEDTGIGIPEDKIEHIFKDFNQADHSVTRRYGGTGLGTTIAKQLVELMGGIIGVNSTQGQGSTFWFEVPIAIQKPDAADDNKNSLKSLRAMLLSSEKQATVVRSAFRDWGLDFDWVKTPARTLSLMIDASESELPYGVAVVEQSMLDMSPEQFSHIIANDEALANTPLVLLADEATLSSEEARHLERHYSSVLPLPLDKTLLFNAIHAARSEHELDDNVVTLSEYYRQTNSASELNILVAEDNEINQKVIKGMLDRAGHRVHIVTDGEQALEALTENTGSYDIAILDMNMPKRSGIDVLKAFRFFDTSASVPVLMVTADATVETMNACMAAGADAYITKPIDAHNLLEKIAGLVKKELSTHKAPPPPCNNTVGFRNDTSLDRQALDNLANLGSGLEFVAELVDVFSIDSKVMLKHADDAIGEKNYLGFREAVHALKGGAAELGGIELVQLCNKAEKLKPYEMLGALPIDLLAKIRQAHGRFLDSMHNYLSRERDIK